MLVPWTASRLTAPARAVGVHHEPALGGEVAPVVHGDTVRVVLWNIHHGIGRAEVGVANRERLEAIGRQIAGYRPDIVVLNEVEFGGVRAGGVNQARFIAQVAGLPWWVEQRNVDLQLGPARVVHGNAVLSRYPLRHAELVELPPDRPMLAILAGHRQAVSVVVEHPQGALRVVGAHLSHRDAAVRRASVGRLLDALAAEPALPGLVAGDLNASWPGSDARDAQDDALAMLDAAPSLYGPIAADAHPTRLHWGPRAPDALVDWVLAPSAWRWQAFVVGADALSDHPPVLAVLRRPAAALR